MKRIGAEIRRRRRKLRWTQDELAARAAVSVDTVVRVELDKSRGTTSVRAIELALNEAEQGRDPARHAGTESSTGSDNPEVAHALATGVLTVNARTYAEIETLAGRLLTLLVSVRTGQGAPAGKAGFDRDAPAAQSAAPGKRAGSSSGGPRG